MSSGSFVIALGIGAFVLAFWVQFRFPNLTPQNLGWALFHLIIAGVLGKLTKVVFSSVELVPVGTMALVFGLALPVLVYSFVTGMWLIRVAQGAMGRGGMTH